MPSYETKRIFSANLQYLLNSQHITQLTLANQMGVSASTVSSWCSGEKMPRMDKIERMARLFQVPTSSLITPAARLTETNIPAQAQLPLLPLTADPRQIPASWQEYIPAPQFLGAEFALRWEGDSMINARIWDGDIVYIRRQSSVDSGQIAAVILDGRITLRRLRQYPDHLVLEAENPMYKPLVFWDGEREQVPIVGMAVGFTSVI